MSPSAASVFQALEADLCAQLQALIDDPDLYIGNAVIDVLVPEQGWHIALAAGDAADDEPMTTAHPVHWASVAKSLTAVLLFLQRDAGLLPVTDLDTPLAAFDLLPAPILEQLHCGPGGNHSGDITLNHLLRHTAGLRDAMVDDAAQKGADAGGLAPDSLVGKLMAAPDGPYNQQWPIWNAERSEDPLAGTLNHFFAERLGHAPLALPGERFSYSDTGYVLLGLLVEKLSGQSLHSLLRDEVLVPLGIEDAWLAYREPSPAVPAPAEVYLGDMPLLENGLSLSFDWGGGGVVSSVSSMNRILGALISGELLSPASTALMREWQTPSGLVTPRLSVGRGLFRTEPRDGELWGHSGSWGAKMFFAPQSGVFFSGTVNQVFASPTWHWDFIETVRRRLTQLEESA